MSFQIPTEETETTSCLGIPSKAKSNDLESAHDIVGIVLIAECVPGEAVLDSLYDGGVGGFRAEQRVVGGVEGQGGGGLVIEQLVALVVETMVDPAKGKFSFCGGFDSVDTGLDSVGIN